jgi:hypothetical protein
MAFSVSSRAGKVIARPQNGAKVGQLIDKERFSKNADNSCESGPFYLSHAFLALQSSPSFLFQQGRFNADIPHWFFKVSTPANRWNEQESAIPL